MDWMELAKRQFGWITRAQLLGCQVAPATVARLVRRGVLQRDCPGLFRLAGHAWDPMSELWRAALVTDGILTAGGALFAHGALPGPPDRLAVYCPQSRRSSRAAGVTVSRRDLSPDLVTDVADLPVVVRWWAALDHVIDLSRPAAVEFADRALQQGWVTMQSVEHYLQHRRRGNPVIREVFALVGDGAESQAEREFARLLTDSGVTGWVTGYRVPGLVGFGPVDFAFPAARVVVEIDGLAYHAESARFQADRSKQNALIALGWRVLRFTWRDVDQRPDHVLDTLAASQCILDHM